tara:strand:- start:55 stop:210 length:156 start_codon:yes stop_codon:yes gene_type:complete
MTKAELTIRVKRQAQIITFLEGKNTRLQTINVISIILNLSLFITAIIMYSL